MATHLVMGKTTSKKALSYVHTQRGANPRLGRSWTGLNLDASARSTYTNVGPKIRSKPKRIFPFCFNFSNRKLKINCYRI